MAGSGKNSDPGTAVAAGQILVRNSNDSVLDSPDNSLSPAEAAAESSRQAAIGEGVLTPGAAAERAVAAAAVEQVLGSGIGGGIYTPSTSGIGDPTIGAVQSTGPVVVDGSRITETREKTHGSYAVMSGITMDLMWIYQNSPNWENLPDGVKVFFFNLAQKSARALCGSALEPDHYLDIGGYAHLAEETVRGISSSTEDSQEA